MDFTRASAVFRHFCRFDASPLTENNLGKIEGPVPYSLRVTDSVQRKSENRRRTTDDDHKVLNQARRLICNRRDLQGRCESKEDAGEVMRPIFDATVALIRKDVTPNLIKPRLEKLKDNQFREDSFFRELIDELWENHRQNSGNPTATWISPQRITANNDAVDDWIDGFAPAPKESRGKSFWIRLGKSKKESNQLEWARDKHNPNWKYIMVEDFPGSCEDFFEHLVHSSFRGRLKSRNLKNQTLHTRAMRHIEYWLHVEHAIGIDNQKQLWTRVHMTWKPEENTNLP